MSSPPQPSGIARDVVWQQCDARPRPTAPPRLEERVRVGDRERQRTAALLGDAGAAGLLDLDELDDRLAKAWRATTGADLAVLEADLPAALRRQRDGREAAVQVRELARAGLGDHVAAYAAVMALLVAIWLAVGGPAATGTPGRSGRRWDGGSGWPATCAPPAPRPPDLSGSTTPPAAGATTRCESRASWGGHPRGRRWRGQLTTAV